MRKLIALLLALVMALSMAACSEEAAKPTTPTTDPTSATKDPATLDELYWRDTYTGSAEDVIAARNTVVATLGSAELTNGMLQIYYWMDVYDFLNTYSSYLSSYGLDYTKPLDEQDCGGSDGTWQHYFLNGALGGWEHFQSMALAADEAQIAILPEYQEEMDDLYDDLTQSAVDGGFASIDAMIQADAGPGCTAEDYYRYNELYYKAYSYFNTKFYEIEVTDAMIEEYFTENEASLAVNGINKKSGDSCVVRHILIEVAEEKTDDDWEKCRQEAQKMLDDWLAGDATEDAFAELAKEHSADPGSKAEGGLYRGLTSETSFVQEFKDWYLEEGRQAGDYGLVKTSYGYHIMYFSGTEPIWVYYCREAVTDAEAAKIVSDAVGKYELVTNYDDILLGEVTITAQ